MELKVFNCFICPEIFQCATDLKVHAKNEHDLSINTDILIDTAEKDLFVRFVRSIYLSSDYIEERVKYYPEHWDKKAERIKIRLMAQKKLEDCSKHIENNMIVNYINAVRYSGWSFDHL